MKEYGIWNKIKITSQDQLKNETIHRFNNTRNMILAIMNGRIKNQHFNLLTLLVLCINEFLIRYGLTILGTKT